MSGQAGTGTPGCWTACVALSAPHPAHLLRPPSPPLSTEGPGASGSSSFSTPPPPEPTEEAGGQQVHKTSFPRTIREDGQLGANQLNKLSGGCCPVSPTSAQGLTLRVWRTWSGSSKRICGQICEGAAGSGLHPENPDPGPWEPRYWIV